MSVKINSVFGSLNEEELDVFQSEIESHQLEWSASEGYDHDLPPPSNEVDILIPDLQEGVRSDTEAYSVIKAWKVIFPESRLDPFFTSHAKVIARDILHTCAEKINKDRGQTPKKELDDKWFHIMSGALLQHKHMSEENSLILFEKMKTLIADQQRCYADALEQNQMLIDNYSKVQKTMDQSIEKLSKLEVKFETPKVVSPGPSISFAKPLKDIISFVYKNAMITWHIGPPHKTAVRGYTGNPEELQMLLKPMSHFDAKQLNRLDGTDITRKYTDARIKGISWDKATILQDV